MPKDHRNAKNDRTPRLMRELARDQRIELKGKETKMAWNLPDGCTDRMVDEAFGYAREPSELAENVRALLEKSRAISKQTLEAILEMIAEDEIESEGPDPDDERDSRADYEWDRRR